MTYQEKLKDPRWQKKRLEILDRDEWCCQICGDGESTLHIHHKYYNNCDPWDCPEDALITLCEDCHKEESEKRPSQEKRLIKAFKIHFLADDLECLSVGLENMTLCHGSEVVLSSIGWALRDEEMQRELIGKYFKSIKRRSNATA